MYTLYYVINGTLSFAGTVSFIEDVTYFPFDSIFYSNGVPVGFRSKSA